MSKWESVLEDLTWPEQTNKVTNPGFETESPLGWIGAGWLTGTGSIARDTNRKFGGNASLKVTHTNQENYYYANQTLILSHVPYRVKARVWIPSTNVPSEYVRLFLGAFSNNTQVDADLTLTDRWQVLKIDNWNPGADAGGAINLMVGTTAATDGIAYFDEIEIRAIDKSREFVKLVRPMDVTVGVSSGDLARGARGWVSVWACEVEMWFATADLQA